MRAEHGTRTHPPSHTRRFRRRREVSQTHDENPKYNGSSPGWDPGLNVGAHLDYGTLSHLCSHVMRNLTQFEGNVYEAMMPLSPTEVGRGYVRADDKAVTTRSGTYSFGCGGATARIFDKYGRFTRNASASPPGGLRLNLTGGEVAVVFSRDHAQRVR